MKKTMMILILAMGLITAVSAQTKEKQTETDKQEHMEKSTYACPMKCEGKKTYVKAGKCPECGMNLAKIEAGKSTSKKSCCAAKGGKKGHKCNMKKANSKAQSSYACPMKCEGDKTYAKAGDCPKCGMHLKETKNEEK